MLKNHSTLSPLASPIAYNMVTRLQRIVHITGYSFTIQQFLILYTREEENRQRVANVFISPIFQWTMLYLVSVDKLKGEGTEFPLTKEEFTTIYLDILQNGRSTFNGEPVSLSDTFRRKGIDSGILKETLEELNRKLLSTKLTEDQLIEKIISTLDELEKFENFLEQKVEETAVFMKYATSAKSDFSEKTAAMLGQIRAFVKELEKTLDEYVGRSAPNLKNVVGYKVAARLLKSFGGVRRLALSSSSTVQIIGAEKAFFRFRKGNGTPPKHGIIYEIPDIYKATRGNSGKISRAYSNAIVKAARADMVGITSESDTKLKKRIEEIKRSGKNRSVS